MHLPTLLAEIDRQEAFLREVVRCEYPERPEIYFNTGSCGRKPESVLQALRVGWEQLNANPTLMTFINPEPHERARAAVSEMLQVDENRIALLSNPTQSLQLILSNLLERGDEFVTTDREHGCVNTIARWLSEDRKVVTRRHPISAFAGSEQFCSDLFAMLNGRTRVVLVSEIGCYTGWRPDIRLLLSDLEPTAVEVVIDGAHAPGQRLVNVSQHRFWVGSGHKWLGGPNGTGFAIMPPRMVADFKPILLGDQYYARKDADALDMTRFESQGTSDTVRWLGLAAACRLYMQTGPELIDEMQLNLAHYFRTAVQRLNPEFRTPDLYETKRGESSSLVVCFWPAERLLVPDLRQALWDGYKIWVQPDFANAYPGLGIRVSCHYANNRSQIDKLVDALADLVKP